VRPFGVPVRRAVSIACCKVLHRAHQKRQVASVLSGLIAFVAEVLDGRVDVSDAQAVGSTDVFYARQDALVHPSFEPDPRIGFEKPHLMIRRIAEMRPELHIEADMAGF
jgi:hypothetical protein